MKKLRAGLFLVLFLIVIISIAACSGGGVNSGSLTVIGLQTSIGESSGNTQILDYRATIKNQSSNDVFIENAEPELSAGIAARVLVDNLIVQVDKNIFAGGTFEVGSSLPFDVTGLTKQDIDRLQPYITGFRIVSDETLRVP